MSSFAAFLAAALSSMGGSSDELSALAGIRRGGAILSTGLKRGNRAADLPLAIEQIKAGGDDDAGPRYGPMVGQVAEHQVAHHAGPYDLGVDERRQHRRRRPAVGQDQQEMPAGAER